MKSLTRALANPFVILTLTALIWGSNSVLGRAAPGTVSPGILTAGRWFVALVICTILFWPQLQRDRALIRQHLWIPIGLGAVGYTMFNYLLYTSLIYLPAATSAIFQSAIPLLIFAINFALFRNAPKLKELIGFSITVLGVATLVTKGDPLAILQTPFGAGELAILAAAFFYALYTVGLKFKPELHWKTFLTLVIFGASLLASFWAILEIIRGAATLPQGLKGWGFILYAGIFPSIIAQGMFIKGVEDIGSARAGLFINLVPVFTALLAIVLLGEPIYLYHLAALILVVGGIRLAQ